MYFIKYVEASNDKFHLSNVGDARRLQQALSEFDVKIRPLLSSMLNYRLPGIRLSEIIALDEVKSQLEKSLLSPLRRGHLYEGAREPTKGVEIFGPPGMNLQSMEKSLDK